MLFWDLYTVRVIVCCGYCCCFARRISKFGCGLLCTLRPASYDVDVNVDVDVDVDVDDHP